MAAIYQGAVADDEHRSISELMARIALAGDGERVSVSDVRQVIGERSFGPLLAVTGMFAASPLGMIPSLPTLLAIATAIIAGQILFGASKAWLPGFLLKRSVKRVHLADAIRRVRPLFLWIDGVLRPRLVFLTHPPFVQIAAAVCLVLAGIIPCLELLPFMATGPCSAIAAFGLAITFRDGLLMLGALGLSAASAALIAVVIF